MKYAHTILDKNSQVLYKRFFVHLISEGHRQLPTGTPLANWLQDREEQLRIEPYQRTENEVVANLLLPLFEENPQNWEALSYLNLDPSDAQARLGDYLHHWYENAPVHHKKFVAGILSMFGLEDALTTASSLLLTEPPSHSLPTLDSVSC